MFFDSHAHLSDDRVDPIVEEVLQRAKHASVEQIINICTDLKSLERGLELVKRHEQVKLAAAIPPHSVDEEGDKAFPIIAEQARLKNLVAIGETGLDYFYHTHSKESQHFHFIQYLNLALEYRLPIIIHCRDAFDDFFQIIDEHYSKKQVEKSLFSPGVLHCFTGTMKDAEKLLERGWMISFSGIVTFKKSIELQEIAKMVPLENLFIETDTPYLAPRTHRGHQNEPAFIVETASFIAELKGLPLEAIADATTNNAKRFFNL